MSNIISAVENVAQLLAPIYYENDTKTIIGEGNIRKLVLFNLRTMIHSSSSQLVRYITDIEVQRLEPDASSIFGCELDS